MKTIALHHTPSIKEVAIPLPSSKSESNRVLIINALAGGKSNLSNLSEARDTRTMIRLLTSDETVLDVGDAGTTMRFLTAFVAAKGLEKILTGTPRMQERPIMLLVDALRSLGATIEYQKKEGYPPIHIKGFKGQVTNELSIRGDISSQYISALLMIAPTLPQGLVITLTGIINSRPYIDMTLALLEQFGISSIVQDNTITISHQNYTPTSYAVESDWSGASYWYSIVALAEKAKIKLKGLKKDSLQGDSEVVNIMKQLGVNTSYEEDGIVLEKSNHKEKLSLDFSTCPDLAQTIAVVCAAKGVPCKMIGLQTLRIKETDRIAALQNELAKIGAGLEETIYDQEWHLTPSSDQTWKTKNVLFHTYEDHRMAMAFAPLATITNIQIEDPKVVEKSYPQYWKDLELAGIKIS